MLELEVGVNEMKKTIVKREREIGIRSKLWSKSEKS